MAQSGYTPISLYYSTTAAATPSSSNLTNGELAINITDGILYYKNSSGTVVPLSSSSGGITWQSVQSANFTATAGNAYPINTTSAAITVTLPASPTSGQLIGLLDYAGTFATNNVVVNPNGNNLNGATSSVKLDQNNEGITFVYSGATQGWVSYSSYKAITPPATTYSASYLVVAGGAGGGGEIGGGGGAGGMLTGTATFTPGVTYTTTVGAGGGGNSAGSASSLTGSGLTSITTVGGGQGGAGYGSAQTPGSAGGSGGGGGNGPVAGGSGTSGQGNNGGVGGYNGPSSYPSGGGGGGKGAVGSGGSGNNGGAGGAGGASSITGSSVTYAGGGGGGGDGSGGSGQAGGGNGGGPGGSGGSASANTGSGGGGGGTGASPGSGGSGVVILSVPTANYSGIKTGSPTITTSGSNTIIKFTASGSYTA